ncbi:CDP-archaeol synthase [Candidatus Woesearchaeota archaeon]|nr:CDP-archaeol synthase [Candidatus Woesearchaeota archaeon]
MALPILQSLYFILPAYLANMAPVLMKNHWKALAVPIDQGKAWHGQPLFGSHKTWRGVVAAVISGFLLFLLQWWLHTSGTFTSLSMVDYAAFPAWTGAVMGLGAILGDLAKSFAKRRVGVASGKPWIPFDQLDFIIGALLATALVSAVPWVAVWILLIASPLLHIATNHAAFFLGIRKEKW